MKFKGFLLLFILVFIIAATLPTTIGEEEWEEWPDATCIGCHSKVTPGIVEQYLEGAMGKPGVQNLEVSSSLGGIDRIPCTTCHGGEHTSFEDWEKARLPDQNTCKACHSDKVEEFLSGKHALAWEAMMAIPMVKEMPTEELLYGCGGCHKIGVKTPEDLKSLGLERPYGIGATCDQCHTRHEFNPVEARQPEACSKCHMGFDHPQWEMWSTSKHGNIYFANKEEYPFDKSLKEVDPKEYPGPTCQLCHMPRGDHEVLTPWGFIALVAFEGRPEGLKVVEDVEWENAKAEVLKALRVLDPQGNPTELLNAVAQLKLVRLTPEEFLEAREKIVEVCSNCHSRDFAIQYLSAADRVIKHSTLQLAEAIKAIKEARERGVYPPRPGEPNNPYPFLLNFYEEPSGVEREAWLIFLEYRMRAFQGMFHVNPDYTHWYGWSEIRRAYKDILEDISEKSEAKSLNVEVEDFKEALKGLEGKIEASKDRVESLGVEVESVKVDVEGLKSKVEGLSESVKGVFEDLEDLNGKLVGVSGSVNLAYILGGLAVAIAVITVAFVFVKK